LHTALPVVDEHQVTFGGEVQYQSGPSACGCQDPVGCGVTPGQFLRELVRVLPGGQAPGRLGEPCPKSDTFGVGPGGQFGQVHLRGLGDSHEFAECLFAECCLVGPFLCRVVDVGEQAGVCGQGCFTHVVGCVV